MAVVLLYHRITEPESDPWLLCVKPRHFAEHLEVLKANYCVRRLDELAITEDKARCPSVVITFDDGYADNLYCAKPHLERFELPATFFITTGYLGSGREFWWDELEHLLLQPGTLPQKLQLVLDGRRLEWALDGSAAYSTEERKRDSAWLAWETAPTPRHALYYSLWSLLYSLTDQVRQSILEEIRIWTKGQPERRDTHRVLTANEIKELSRNILIEVAAHSVTHSRLSSLPKAIQWEEIRRSKADLEAIIAKPVTSFSYPFGKAEDYSLDDTVPILREAGYSRACSNCPGRVGSDADKYQIPRFHVQDWNGEEFSKQLSNWCRG